MKKLLLLLLLVSSLSDAQIVTIPDANFKAKLLMANPNFQIAKDAQGNNITIDTNADGQIQVSEAMTVYELNLSLFGASFTNLTGILAFSNLKSLDFSSNPVTNLNLNGLDLETLGCSFCNLTSLNLSIFPHLKHLSCGSNNITILDLSQVPLLESLTCRYNQLFTLDLQYVPNLHYLDCQNNHIGTLNLSATPNMNFLLCDGNQLSTIDLSNVVHLNQLGCGYNTITSLNLSNVPNLEHLSFSNCQVTSLDLSNVPILKSLVFPFNQIATIDLSDVTQLTTLWCFNNLLTSLNIDNNPNLEQLDCHNNQITTIVLSNPNLNLTGLNFSNNLISGFNFANTPSLTYALCNNNLLTSLDLSNLLYLNEVDCSYNDLIEMSVKNGRIESSLDFSNNPNLIFICADEQQIVSVQNQLNSLGMNYAVCNSYCSFEIGGNHNTISGLATFDFNNNGCDTSDAHFPLIKFKINDGFNDLGASATNSNGIYTFYTLLANNYIFPDVENPNWFNFSPNSANIVFPNSNNNTATQDFCITANGVHPDVETVIMPITLARPGFDAIYKIVYKNKGNQIMSGSINFQYNDAVLDFVSATLNPDLQNVGNLNWNYTNLLPFESRSFEVVLNVNTPTETPAVNIGDVFNFTVVINPISGDELPLDNTFNFNQTVVGSYDPNDKVCLEGTTAPTSKIGDYLHYTINFENTGTAPATFVVVKDIIDTTKFDLSSLQIMHSSHAMETRITGNKIEYIFNNINLGPNEHGNVTFKIKTKSTLVEGNTVTNKADIYFDYNFPIETNIASTTFQTLSNSQFEMDNSVVIAPNPTKNNVNINVNNNIKTVELFDVQGRVLATQIVNNSQSVLDVSHYTNGIYFVKVTTEKGSKVEKIIKE